MLRIGESSLRSDQEPPTSAEFILSKVEGLSTSLDRGDSLVEQREQEISRKDILRKSSNIIEGRRSLG